MLVQSSRALVLLPQFSRISQNKSVGIIQFCSSALNTIKKTDDPKRNEKQESGNKLDFDKFRFKYPDFLPRTTPVFRNALLEKLERRDMLRRRNILHIPEFYVGSVLAVTTSDKHSPGKMTRFVGICIMKENSGIRSTFLLRNVIEQQGIEIKFSLYSPLIQKIEVLRLEKRLDNNLLYLRDAPHEFSTFPFDMLQEYYDETKPVPVNTLKVPLNPRPWIQRYERMDLKGAVLPELSEKLLRQAKERAKPWERFDLMDEYRQVIPKEEQKDIFDEIIDELKILESRCKSEKKKKVFMKPSRQKVF